MGWVSKKIVESIERSQNTDSYWIEKAKFDFALQLDHVRKLADIKSKTLAEKLGTSAAYISRVFRGDTNLTIESMVKLARATNARLEIKIIPSFNAAAATTVDGHNVVLIPTSFFGKLHQTRNASNTEIKVELGKKEAIENPEQVCIALAA